jgi:hypothetical protein
VKAPLHLDLKVVSLSIHNLDVPEVGACHLPGPAENPIQRRLDITASTQLFRHRGLRHAPLPSFCRREREPVSQPPTPLVVFDDAF